MTSNDLKDIPLRGDERTSTNSPLSGSQRPLKQTKVIPKNMRTGTNLTPKQKAFADTLLDNPTISGTKAVQQTYDVKTYDSAASLAKENIRKPQIMAYLAKYSSKAEQRMIEVAEYATDMGKTFSKEGASYAAVAVQANKDILDRVHGKARQQIDVTSTALTFNVDMTAHTTSSVPDETDQA